MTTGGKTLNFNIGMLGHVDSGKTSLAKALSSISSTAAFDKNPQSKERGITLDLGFSSFQTAAPKHLDDKFDKIQYTLVDCPGHASLIKTIIGGAQIIDLMILVVDVMKGIQTQTAECLIIGEIICPKILVILNKIDLLPEGKRQTAIDKMSRKMLKTLERTKFKSSASVVAVAAHPGSESATDDNIEPQGMEELVQVLQAQTYEPDRSCDGPFIFSVDHCFSIRGQGTVMTGTVLSGRVHVNDVVEIANLQITRKVKSIQMFRQSVTSLQQGDRGACCVTQFDPKSLERGIVCTPAVMTSYHAAIVEISKISYYQGQVVSKCRYHVTVGHSTVMCKVTLFTSDSDDKFDLQTTYRYKNELDTTATCKEFGLLEFEKPIICMEDNLLIGSKLDVDVNTNKCRLAFKARILKGIAEKDFSSSFLPKLLIYKNKEREGVVERMHDDYTVICKNLLKKESNMELFSQLKVQLSTGESGFIEGTFGQSGKTKIRIPDGLSPSTREQLGSKKKKNNSHQQQQQQPQQTIKVLMNFRRYIYDPSKSIKQV